VPNDAEPFHSPFSVLVQFGFYPPNVGESVTRFPVFFVLIVSFFLPCRCPFLEIVLYPRRLVSFCLFVLKEMFSYSPWFFCAAFLCSLSWWWSYIGRFPFVSVVVSLKVHVTLLSLLLFRFSSCSSLGFVFPPPVFLCFSSLGLNFEYLFIVFGKKSCFLPRLFVI